MKSLLVEFIKIVDNFLSLVEISMLKLNEKVL